MIKDLKSCTTGTSWRSLCLALRVS